MQTKALTAMLSVLALAGCDGVLIGGHAPDRVSNAKGGINCGNNVCSGKESCVNCPADCGECPELVVKAGPAPSPDAGGVLSPPPPPPPVFNVTFDNREHDAAYTEGYLEEDFGLQVPYISGDLRTRKEGSNGYLQVTYPANAIGGASGPTFMIPFGNSYEELWLKYRVRFDDDFQFKLGGKLPGLCGGSCPSGAQGNLDGFSARGMWVCWSSAHPCGAGTGNATQYLYYPAQFLAGLTYGEEMFYQVDGSDQAFDRGNWHTVIHHIKMNDSQLPTNSGKLEVWFDDNKVLSKSNFVWRVDGRSYGIDALAFSTFFGGNTMDWAPSTPQHAHFDDFYLTTQALK
jgi:hypothetical protein